MGVLAEQVRESSRAFGDVFRNRGLRRINLALVGSSIGDWAYGIAVSIWAYQQGGATALGVFGVVRFVTLALLAPVMATLADRYPRRAVMVGTDLVRMVLVVIAAGAIAAGAADVVVYALALLTSVVGTAFRPAQAAMLPLLADDPAELTAANVVASTVESVSFFAGPAIAGFLLAVTDIEVVYLFNAATFLWSAIMLIGLPAGRVAGGAADEAGPTAVALEGDPLAGPVDGGPDAKEGFVAEVLAGFRSILGDRHLRLIAGLYAAQTVMAGASLVYEVAIVLELLEMSESGLGLVDAVLGVGGIIGGFVALVLARRQRIALDFGYGVMLWSAPLLLVVIWPTLAATLVAMFLIGLANSLVDINAYTIIQRVTPSEVMGRVFGALESIVVAGMAVGALAMPIMINTIGLRAGLAVIGISVASLVVVSLAALRGIDRTVLAPAGLPLLRGVPMLSVLPAALLERLARSLVPRTVAAGDDVFREGDPGDRFWVIEGGTASVWIDGVEVRQLGPGDSFGEIALLRDIPRTATVRAEEELVLHGLDREHFLPAVTAHGESHEMADSVVNRLLTLG